jgi:hypothetical protein
MTVEIRTEGGKSTNQGGGLEAREIAGEIKIPRF